MIVFALYYSWIVQFLLTEVPKVAQNPFQDILKAKLAEVEKRLRQEKESLVTGACPDELDQVVAMAARDTEVCQINNLSTTRMQILEALQRIQEGTFGYCQGCDEPISQKRLKALPWALLCISCQQEAEQKTQPGGHLDSMEAAA